jgi:hypothetical protein
LNNKKITVFLYSTRNGHGSILARQLIDHELVEKIFFLLIKNDKQIKNTSNEIPIENIFSSAVINEILNRTKTDFALFVFDKNQIEINTQAIFRLIKIAETYSAGITFSDYKILEGEIFKSNPLIDYQYGSVRDDFDFGSMVLISRDLLQKYSNELGELTCSGFYSLVLFASRNTVIKRVPETLYVQKKTKDKIHFEKQFEYVDISKKDIQIEREKVVTDHLKKIGAFISNASKLIETNESSFKVEASVIIPVKNREATIADAIKSALGQKTEFEFNVIIVDNHSADKTSSIIKSFNEKDPRVIHIIPESKILEIGGCWNLAINNARCGKFSVQLDSDDLYIDDQTLQKIISKFHQEKTAMLIGSYKLVDFQLNEIPPGIIDHTEWTDDNGSNNALRINGLGAPRAYYTPLIRQIQFPNVSYGEDYAVVLEIIRDYKISRIFEPIYLCRRWHDNTDSQISREKENENNWYKDFIRTNEILNRKK